MNRITRATPSPAMVVSVLALIAAMAGTALAGSGPSATGAASAKKQAKKALKKAKAAQQSADAAQQSADAAQGSADAAQGSADAAQGSADAITGRSAYDEFCNPASTTFLDCVGVTVTLAQSGRVLLNASGGQEGEASAAQGDCRLEVDDSTAAIPHSTTNMPGENVTDNTSNTAQNGFANTAVTGVLPAGAHAFELSCNERFGDQEIHDSMISAVRVSG